MTCQTIMDYSNTRRSFLFEVIRVVSYLYFEYLIKYKKQKIKLSSTTFNQMQVLINYRRHRCVEFWSSKLITELQVSFLNDITADNTQLVMLHCSSDLVSCSVLMPRSKYSSSIVSLRMKSLWITTGSVICLASLMSVSSLFRW